MEVRAVGHVDDPPGRAPARSRVVGDHDDGLAAVDELVEQVRSTASAVCEVQVAGRLVGDQDRRVVGQGAGDRDALLLPARGRRRQLAGLVGHLDLLEQRPWPAPRARVGVHRPPKSIGSITFSTTVSVGSSWKNWKMTPTVRPRQSATWPSVRSLSSWPATVTVAGGGPVDAGDHVDERRLAAAGLADDGDELAVVDLQVDAVEGAEGARRR